MNCHQIQDSLVEWLRGELPQDVTEAVEMHCANCPECARERDELMRAWTSLTEWPNEAPSPRLKERFDVMLRSYESGMRAARPSLVDRIDAWLQQYWPSRPVAQAGLVMATLIMGLFLGGAFRSGHGRLESMQFQMNAMQEMVALTMETARSSSEKLEALNIAARMESPGELVLKSLMVTLKEDPSTNVRLAAVDALIRFTHRQAVLDTLSATLKTQPSPLVQTALINLIAQSGSSEALARIVSDKALDPAVHDHAQKKLDAMI